MRDHITGHVVEIGDLEALDNQPGILIRTTREQLRDHGRNLAFNDVRITLADQPATPSASEASQPGPVAAVYAKYKHLDRVFSMLAERDDGPTAEGNPIHRATADLWRAIKQQEAP
jgi:hypothetical protein